MSNFVAVQQRFITWGTLHSGNFWHFDQKIVTQPLFLCYSLDAKILKMTPRQTKVTIVARTLLLYYSLLFRTRRGTLKLLDQIRSDLWYFRGKCKNLSWTYHRIYKELWTCTLYSYIDWIGTIVLGIYIRVQA